ncbi:uncharacterized protein J3D65DRAFT_670524 [Phyllosticta citribraziliensis]|uniref:F-box domain-containing protein n=1 Tax=Phyllosticta citribraziliensis TaxID=989973 RepID=A0ABR1LDL9_9PEZI
MSAKATMLIASELSQQPYSALERLPGEMVSAIARFVSPRDILSLRLASKKLHHEMDREMKWALKGAVRPFYLEFSQLLNFKWVGERRIAKHLTSIVFKRPSISNFAETEFYKKQFIPTAHKALKGFENLESVSIMLWNPMDLSLGMGGDPDDIPWCFETISQMLQGLEHDISFSADNRHYRCEVPRLGICKRTIDEVILRGGNDLFTDLDDMLAALWSGITNTLLSGCQYPSILRLSQMFVKQSFVDRIYSPTKAPDVLFLEDVVEFAQFHADEDGDEDGIFGRDARRCAFQRLVSHPKYNLRELSLVRCQPSGRNESWIPFFEALKKHKHLENLRFEDVRGVRFDWDSDGNLDNGTRLPEIIKELGMEQALDKMINAYRQVAR